MVYASDDFRTLTIFIGSLTHVFHPYCTVLLQPTDLFSKQDKPFSDTAYIRMNAINRNHVSLSHDELSLYQRNRYATTAIGRIRARCSPDGERLHEFRPVHVLM